MKDTETNIFVCIFINFRDITDLKALRFHQFKS